MPIVQSSIVEVNTQVDGRSYVTESLTDDSGDVLIVTYLAGQKDDIQENLSARVVAMNESEADADKQDADAQQSVKDLISTMDKDQLAAVAAIASLAADDKVQSVADAIQKGVITPEDVLLQAATIDADVEVPLDGSQIRS